MQSTNEKGQFFLVATLVIITIIFSFSIIYISSSAPNSETANTDSIAKDIKYESIQLINQGVYNNQSFDSIEANLTNFMYFYSKAYPLYNMTFILENSTSPLVKQLKNSNAGILGSSQFSYTLNNVNVSLNNLIYTFNISKGYDFYIILQLEEGNETYIATA